MVPNDSAQNRNKPEESLTLRFELLSDQFFFFFRDLLDNYINFFFWSQNNNNWRFDNSLKFKFEKEKTLLKLFFFVLLFFQLLFVCVAVKTNFN